MDRLPAAPVRAFVLLATAVALSSTCAAPLRAQAETERLRDAAFRSHGARNALLALCDGIGPRLSGQPAHAAAAEWARDRLERFGYRARLETVELPASWRRGAATATLVAPLQRPLPLLAAGWTPGLASADEPARLTVLVDPPADGGDEAFAGRAVLAGRDAVPLAPRAAHPYAGAELVLLDAGLPWAALTTGFATWGAAGAAGGVPCAFIAHEDAGLMRRIDAAGGEVELDCHLDDGLGPATEVPVVVADLRAAGERADELVLAVAPLDSWDVGQGAVAGAGAAALLEAARLLAELDERPARSLRLVLLGGTRQGLGTAAYAARHAEELAEHVAGVVLPGGGGPVRGIALALQHEVLPLAEEWFAPFADDPGLGVDDVGLRHGETHLPQGLQEACVPLFELVVQAPRRDQLDGTRADTVDKVLEANLRQAAYVTATVLWRIAAGPAPPRFESAR